MAESKVIAVGNGLHNEKTGWTNYKIEFENGDVGTYGTKEGTQTAFVPGQVAKYDKVVNGNYTTIKPITDKSAYTKSYSNSGSKWQPKSPEEIELDRIGKRCMIMRYAVDIMLESWKPGANMPKKENGIESIDPFDSKTMFLMYKNMCLAVGLPTPEQLPQPQPTNPKTATPPPATT